MVGKTVSAINRLLLSLFMIALVGSAQGTENMALNSQSEAFIKQLATEIERADRIVVTEHSNRFDTRDPNADYVEVIYGTRVLDAAQKDAFLQATKALDPETKNAYAGCIFVPHHSIYFYSNATLLSTLDVCFECGDIDWSIPAPPQPWAIISGLSKLVSDLGFAPERDWKALAQQAAATEQQTNK